MGPEAESGRFIIVSPSTGTVVPIVTDNQHIYLTEEKLRPKGYKMPASLTFYVMAKRLRSWRLSWLESGRGTGCSCVDPEPRV